MTRIISRAQFLAMFAMLACSPQQPAEEVGPGGRAAEVPARTEAPAAPDSVAAPGAGGADVASPDADSLLPALPGYTTDDDAEPGEVRSSLDHGEIAYDEVRRRLVLDDAGFTLGDVTVVTFEPHSGVGERVLAHMFGSAGRSTIRIAGEEMVRIDTQPFATIAWSGDGFVMVFGRGQARSDAWLEELVRATVDAVRRQS